MLDFLRATWGDLEERRLLGELRMIRDGRVDQYFDNDLEELERRARLSDSLEGDVYFGVMPRVRNRGTAEDTVPEHDVIWTDFDAKTWEQGKPEAFAALSGVPLSPQIIIDSGNGYHAYWLLDDLYPFPQVQAVMKGIEQTHGSDHCSDAARVLRVPGTHNHKNGEKKPVRLVRFDLTGRRHRLSDFSDYVDTVRDERPRTGTIKSTDGWNPSADDAPKFPEGTRNHSLTRQAGIMVARGMGYDEILVQLGHENQVRCDPPLPDREVVAIVRSVQRYR